MARPKHEQPTPAELDLLRILWASDEALTVREVMALLDDSRAYTSVMSLMDTMSKKGLLGREPRGRAFAYVPIAPQQKTLSGMAGDLLNRAFDGSAGALVANLLDGAKPSLDELEEIQKAIRDYKKQLEM
jgi:BlaI family penicillinase repressor